jgi:hypothetical protein
MEPIIAEAARKDYDPVPPPPTEIILRMDLCTAQALRAVIGAVSGTGEGRKRTDAIYWALAKAKVYNLNTFEVRGSLAFTPNSTETIS